MMKRVLYFILSVLIFIVVGSALYARFSDDRPAPEIVSETYTRAEDVADNAVIDLMFLAAPENLEKKEMSGRLIRQRVEHDMFFPEHDIPLLQENERLKFKGMSWLYTCWLVSRPAPGPCLQPFAFEHNGMEVNKLFLDRYNTALEKKNFASDAFSVFDDTFFGIAMLHMASASFYFDKGQHDNAVDSWKKHHLNIVRFLKEGQNTFSSVSALMNLYSLSVQQAERFVVKGSSQEQSDILTKTISAFSPADIDLSVILKTEISARRDEFLSELRPSGRNLLSLNFFNIFFPFYPDRLFNTLIPDIKKLNEVFQSNISASVNSVESDEYFKNTEQQDPLRRIISLEAHINALSAYFKIAAADEIMQKAVAETGRRAFLLSVKMKNAGIYDASGYNGMQITEDLYNPITGKQFVFDEINQCLIYSMGESEYCVSTVNGTPVNFK